MTIINSINPVIKQVRAFLTFSLTLNFLLVVWLMVERRYTFSLDCTLQSSCGQFLASLGFETSLNTIIVIIAVVPAFIAGIIAFSLSVRHGLLNARQKAIALSTLLFLLTSLLTSQQDIWFLYTFALISLGFLAIWSGEYFGRSEVNPGNKNIRFYLGWLLLSFTVILMGIWVSAIDAGKYCVGFPVCADLSTMGFEGWLAFGHRVMTALLAIASVWILRITWLYYRRSSRMLISVTMAFTLLGGQVLLGALQVLRDFPAELVVLHAVSASGYLVAVLIAFQAAICETPDEISQPYTIFNDRQRLKDFYLLNKPIIVILLLVTTYAGMVVSIEKFPSLQLTFWTILAGALAAGGSSAINQFIDREIDLSMQRTANRPVPAGRLMPSEALALGIAEIVVSFYIYVSFVNVTAALLAMLGMFYYVFIYSLWLKHATVQNIVIGGGAGAIPPLVGWAAASGSLNIPSLFLFALVFLWTPPHFWALALVRKNDYARAKVPMMPVVNGEKSTRIQIFIYTIQLVVLTLIMPLFKLGGNIYLVAAIVLGLWLLHAAWRVLTRAGNKVAYKMYRYSSMYLAFIFLALAIDALV